MRVNAVGTLLVCFLLPVTLFSQTVAVAPTNNPPPKPVTLLETLVVDPAEIKLDAEHVIEGLVVNVKDPTRVIANNVEQSIIVTSTEFRNTNQRFAARGMHSWLNVSYKIKEENKRLTLYLLEFIGTKEARVYFGLAPEPKEGEEQSMIERKGDATYSLLQGNVMLQARWSEPRTAGIEQILTAYKTKFLGLPSVKEK